MTSNRNPDLVHALLLIKAEPSRATSLAKRLERHFETNGIDDYDVKPTFSDVDLIARVRTSTEVLGNVLADFLRGPSKSAHGYAPGTHWPIRSLHPYFLDDSSLQGNTSSTKKWPVEAFVALEIEKGRDKAVLAALANDLVPGSADYIVKVDNRDRLLCKIHADSYPEIARIVKRKIQLPTNSAALRVLQTRTYLIIPPEASPTMPQADEAQGSDLDDINAMQDQDYLVLVEARAPQERDLIQRLQKSLNAHRVVPVCSRIDFLALASGKLSAFGQNILRTMRTPVPTTGQPLHAVRYFRVEERFKLTPPPSLQQKWIQAYVFIDLNTDADLHNEQEIKNTTILGLQAIAPPEKPGKPDDSQKGHGWRLLEIFDILGRPQLLARIGGSRAGLDAAIRGNKGIQTLRALPPLEHSSATKKDWTSGTSRRLVTSTETLVVFESGRESIPATLKGQGQ